MMQYINPRFVYHGEQALDGLKSLKGKKAVICIGGGSIKRGGHLDRIEAMLKESGFETKLIEGIESDPSVTTVLEGAKVMEEFQPDWIIAIGGGSPIDAAKAMWVKYEYPEITFEQMCTPFGLPELRTKSKFCAITTTSGTGTEVTAFAVITDYDKGIKYPMADFNITPDVAIVDPVLVEGLPKKLVAFTGMDAFTHAIEAYISNVHSPYSDAVALHAIRMIYDNLLASYAGDMEARAAMHDAQCLAGMAFSNGLLGIVHSMAHKTGAAFDEEHIIHGCANAMYLPKVIKYNAGRKETAERLADIADAINLGGRNTPDKVERLIALCEHFNHEMNIPMSINEYGKGGRKVEPGQGVIPAEEFEAKVSEIAANALLDACTLSNPREIDQKEMEMMLSCCFYNKEVLF